MSILITIAGFALIIMAVFAYQLGLDNNNVWGPSRYILFLIGVFFIVSNAALRLQPVSHLFNQLQSTLRKFRQKVVSRLAVLVRPLQRMIRSTAVSVVLALLVLSAAGIYAFWFTSQGYFPTFPKTYNPYVELGDAFLHGQVALLEQPDPRLAAIKDPIRDVAAREKIPYHLDLSYYNSKYYAYWGPIPGLLNAAIQAAAGKKPAGALAPLIFYTCYGITLAFILFTIRKWAFPHAPGISIALYLMPGVVSVPYVFMLSKNDVYETAILAGQCFLFIGLAGWLVYLMTHHSSWLILTGTCYALAIGSRYNLAIAVCVFLTFAIWEIKREGFFTRAALQNYIMLLVPLALMAISLSIYNYARFGNPLQTGLQYQLGDPNFQHQYYSYRFIPSNLYGYLLTPASLRNAFPFVITREIQKESFPNWAQWVPGKEFEQAMLGGLPWIPIFWLLVVIIPLLVILLRRNWTNPLEAESGLRNSAARRFFLMITLAGCLEAVHALFYYYGAMRFTADFYALFLLALVLLSWEVDDHLALSDFPFSRMLRINLWLSVIILAPVTTLIGFLAGFEIPPQIFRLSNHYSYNQIAQIFDAQAKVVTQLFDSPTLFGAILRKIIR